MNKPMIITTGTGFLGVVTEKRDLGSTYSRAEIRTKKVNDRQTHFELELYFDALNDRKVIKLLTLTSAQPITREKLKAIIQERCERIAKAQMRARRLWLQRKPSKPMPVALRQAALKEFFPEHSPTKAQWLARVRSCKDLPEPMVKVLEKERIDEFIQSGDYASLEEYAAAIPQMHEQPAGTQKRALHLFLFSYWNEITKPGRSFAYLPRN